MIHLCSPMFTFYVSYFKLIFRILTRNSSSQKYWRCLRECLIPDFLFPALVFIIPQNIHLILFHPPLVFVFYLPWRLRWFLSMLRWMLISVRLVHGWMLASLKMSRLYWNRSMVRETFELTAKKMRTISHGLTDVICVSFIACVRPNARRYKITHASVRSYRMRWPVWLWRTPNRRKRVAKNCTTMRRCAIFRNVGPSYRYAYHIFDMIFSIVCFWPFCSRFYVQFLHRNASASKIVIWFTCHRWKCVASQWNRAAYYTTRHSSPNFWNAANPFSHRNAIMMCAKWNSMQWVSACRRYCHRIRRTIITKVILMPSAASINWSPLSNRILGRYWRLRRPVQGSVVQWRGARHNAHIHWIFRISLLLLQCIRGRNVPHSRLEEIQISRLANHLSEYLLFGELVRVSFVFAHALLDMKV